MRGRGRGQGQGRPARGRRRAVHMLQPTLLLLLHRGPAHGYPLLEKTREFGLVGLDPSVVYRALRDMEEEGSVISTWDEEQTQGPPRRVYRLTAAGDEALGMWMRDLQGAGRRIEHLLDAYDHHMQLGEGEHH